MTRRVVFSPEAQGDLLQLYDFIAGRAGEARALGYVERIAAHCTGFADFPERGTRRDDIRPDLHPAAALANHAADCSRLRLHRIPIPVDLN